MRPRPAVRPTGAAPLAAGGRRFRLHDKLRGLVGTTQRLACEVSADTACDVTFGVKPGSGFPAECRCDTAPVRLDPGAPHTVRFSFASRITGDVPCTIYALAAGTGELLCAVEALVSVIQPSFTVTPRTLTFSRGAREASVHVSNLLETLPIRFRLSARDVQAETREAQRTRGGCFEFPESVTVAPSEIATVAVRFHPPEVRAAHESNVTGILSVAPLGGAEADAETNAEFEELITLFAKLPPAAERLAIPRACQRISLRAQYGARATATVPVRNAGEAPAQLRVTVSGGPQSAWGDAPFVLDTRPAFDLPPGAEERVRVAFCPGEWAEAEGIADFDGALFLNSSLKTYRLQLHGAAALRRGEITVRPGGVLFTPDAGSVHTVRVRRKGSDAFASEPLNVACEVLARSFSAAQRSAHGEGLSIDGSASAFHVSGAHSLSLLPGQAAELRVEFAPERSDAVYATKLALRLRGARSGRDRGAYQIPLWAVAGAPDVQLLGARAAPGFAHRVALEPRGADGLLRCELTFRNEGTSAAFVSVPRRKAREASPVQLSPESFTLPVHSSQKVAVCVAASGSGADRQHILEFCALDENLRKVYKISSDGSQQISSHIPLEDALATSSRTFRVAVARARPQ